MANIKQHWQQNMISFRRGKTKVRVITKEQIYTPQDTTPLYADVVQMLEGLVNEEVHHFLEDHSTIVPLFKINIITTANPYVSEQAKEEKYINREPDPKSIEELRYAREALERELAISQQVKVSILEEINLGTITDPRTLKIAKELVLDEHLALVGLLTEYKDIFA